MMVTSKKLIGVTSQVSVGLSRVKKGISRCLTKKLSIVCLLVIAYGLVFSYLSIVKYRTYNATAWDLGIFSQSLYTTLNKNLFFHNNLEFGSHFHVHFSPILILLLPFYAVCQSPIILLILQSFGIALAAIPIHYIAKKELSDRASLVFPFLYLMSPALYGANFFDFHPVSLAPLFILASILFFKIARWKEYFVFIFLALMVKEDVSLIVIAIGFYGIAKNIRMLLKRRLNQTTAISLLTIIIGAVWLAFSLKMISHFVAVDGYGILWNSGYSHHTGNVYEQIGGEGGIFGILASLINDPARMVIRLLDHPTEKLVYLAGLFMPLCMLSWLDLPSVLLFLPTLMEYFLASDVNYFSLSYQYPTLLAPVVFIAALNGFRKLTTRYKTARIRRIFTRPIFYLMIFSSFMTTLFVVPTILSGLPLGILEQHRSRDRMLSLILNGTDIRILTQNDYFPHMSNSLYAYAYWNTTNVDYVLLDLSSKWYHSPLEIPDEYVAKYGIPDRPFFPYVSKFVDRDFGLLAQDQVVLLYKEAYKGSVIHYVPYVDLFDWRWLSTSGVLVGDPLSVSEKVFLHRAVDPRDDFFWSGPYVAMPPGKYEVMFRLKVGNATDRYVLTLDVTRDSGNETLANHVVFGGEFSEVGVWQWFTLEFQLDELTRNVEFRGVDVSNSADVYFDFVSVAQTEPYDPVT